MNPTKQDVLLAVECSTSVTFHYYDDVHVTIVDPIAVEKIKQVALKDIEENYDRN